MSTQPLVALVVLTCNQKEITHACLQSLQRADYENLEIVLVDNGSTDGTYEHVTSTFPKVHCLRNEHNLGAAGGRNVGIDYALSHFDFTYIMFMDNDIVVTPHFLSRLVDGLRECREKGVEIASPKLYLMDSDRTIDCAGGAKVNFFLGSTQTRGHGEEDTGQYDHDLFPQCVPTTVLLHKNALLRAGTFDVSYDPYGYEDLDFVLRANKPGAPFRFVPDAVVYHKGSKTGFEGYSGDYTKVKAQNFKRFLKRHSSSFERAVFYILLPFIAAKIIARELSRGKVDTLLGMVKGFMRG